MYAYLSDVKSVNRIWWWNCTQLNTVITSKTVFIKFESCHDFCISILYDQICAYTCLIDEAPCEQANTAQCRGTGWKKNTFGETRLRREDQIFSVMLQLHMIKTDQFCAGCCVFMKFELTLHANSYTVLRHSSFYNYNNLNFFTTSANSLGETCDRLRNIMLKYNK